MRICIDARSLRETKPSGISLYTLELVRALLRMYPDDYFVLFTNGLKGPSLLDEFSGVTNCERIEKKIPSKLLHAAFSFFRAPSWESLVGRCDAYFFPNVMYVPRMPKPSVLTVHDISYLLMPRVYSFRNHMWYRFVHAQRQLREARLCVADSYATQSALELIGRSQENSTRVVYLAGTHPPKGFSLQQPEFFLVLGDIDERKNIFGILSAYKRAREAAEVTLPIKFVGKRGYVNLRKSTASLFESLKTEGWLIEEGYVTEEKKWEAISKARAMIFVSLHEGFGFPGLEAQAAGVPLIASNRTSLPEVFGEGPLYVNPSNTESIRRALRIVSADNFSRSVIYDNPLLRRTWNDVARDMMNIFRQASNV